MSIEQSRLTLSVNSKGQFKAKDCTERLSAVALSIGLIRIYTLSDLDDLNNLIELFNNIHLLASG